MIVNFTFLFCSAPQHLAIAESYESVISVLSAACGSPVSLPVRLGNVLLVIN